MWQVYLIRAIPWTKRNWKWVISVIIILWLAGWLNGIKVKYQRQVNELTDTNIRLKRNNVEQWERDSLSIVKKAEENEELKDILESQVKATVKYQDLYLHEKAKATITDTTVLVEFEKDTKCYLVEGWTEANLLTKKSIYDLSVSPKPTDLQIDITKIMKGEVYGRMKPGNDCIEVDTVIFNTPPDVGQTVRYGTNWFWTGIALGVGVTLGLLAH